MVEYLQNVAVLISTGDVDANRGSPPMLYTPHTPAGNPIPILENGW